MTQEEKDLILKVCYESLVYGITVYVEHDTFYDEREPYKAKISIKSHQILDDFANYPLSSKLLVRPYLRPMSSMTEEEWRTMHNCCNAILMCDKRICIQKSKFGSFSELQDAYTTIDWLDAHHFDYRGLIGRGLALEAPKGMYKF